MTVMPSVHKFHLLRSMYAKFVDECYEHCWAFPYLAMRVLGHSNEYESLAYVSVKLEGVESIRDMFGVLSIDDDPPSTCGDLWDV
jgi:hypothetical protein